MPLHAGNREVLELKLPAAPGGKDRDVLSVVLDDGDGHELWHKNIPVMLVLEPQAHTHASASRLRDCDSTRRSRCAIR